MPGGKGKSVGGKGDPKTGTGRTQKSHSAKAGLQVSNIQKNKSSLFSFSSLLFFFVFVFVFHSSRLAMDIITRIKSYTPMIKRALFHVHDHPYQYHFISSHRIALSFPLLDGIISISRRFY